MKQSPTASSPPSLVSLAVLLIAGTFAAGMVKWVCLSDWANPIGNLLLLFLGVLALGWLLKAIREGGNLWRLFFAFLFLGGVAITIVQPPTFIHSWELFFFWGQALVQLCASIMLFLPESARWFSRHRQT